MGGQLKADKSSMVRKLPSNGIETIAEHNKAKLLTGKLQRSNAIV